MLPPTPVLAREFHVQHLPRVRSTYFGHGSYPTLLQTDEAGTFDLAAREGDLIAGYVRDKTKPCGRMIRLGANSWHRQASRSLAPIICVQQIHHLIMRSCPLETKPCDS